MGLARVLLSKKMLLMGNFVLSSGKMSPYYLDLRKFPSYPEFREVVEKAMELLKEVKFDSVVGVATGGLPLAGFLACRLNLPMAYVRSERKGHGTDRLLEGEVEGKEVVIVDDVATTGSSLERALIEVSKQGGKVKAAMVIVDRQEGAKSRIESYGATLLSVSKISDILRELLESGLLAQQEEAAVREYLVSNVEA
jgi:orotate phosphoribosyltransferase